MRTQILLTATVLAMSAPLAACATAPGYSGGPSGYASANVASYGAGPAPAAQPVVDDGLLSEPPADAKAGQCFAKVVVPGQPVYGPPAGPHLKWVQSPPPPGAIGPIWCQVWEQGYQPTVTLTPERYGWIRVICDKDATRDKIGHLQHRLHDWGVYQGGYDGQYDAATAAAVTRFQGDRHIEHGGYLSYRTMEALEVAPPPAPVAPPVTYAQGYAGQGYGYSAQGYGYSQQTYAAPVYQPPLPQPPVYLPAPCPGPCQPPVYQPQPCGPAPCQGGWGQNGSTQPGYGQPAYGNTRGYSVQRWLNWAGKTGY